MEAVQYSAPEPVRCNPCPRLPVTWDCSPSSQDAGKCTCLEPGTAALCPVQLLLVPVSLTCPAGGRAGDPQNSAAPDTAADLWATRTSSSTSGGLFSHLFPCFSGPPPVVEAQDNTYKQQEDFHFILILTCPQLLSMEDLVMAAPGAGRLQQLLSLSNTCAAAPCSASPLQKVSAAL